ncbi:putative polyketide synthase [Hypoxylon trugodes]|uniref:putative polyketide synthase n=1 Tax=Hypoxylon trugodes TaxID=326681 RepID=UPI0021969C19|nr:putative polyketide synthase [Hypoxylon trugodes]KAI1383543.1 putative polyketide synthase [Hypoxylon trugodes]
MLLSIRLLDNRIRPICGFSIKFPGDATTPENLWKMMVEKRCSSTEFPAGRLNPNGFYQAKSKANTLPLRGGHFIEEDLSRFDAEFFSISPTEASSMDPMQRWLLETAYRALENAGISMESVAGSRTAVYTGSFSLDYLLQLARDPECPPTYAALGLGLSMLANRLSWFFDLRGPSIGLDSACSSTGMATDIACQALRNGSCDTAMVAGSNLAHTPEMYLWMSNVNFLSPDSKCYSFDERGNGYSRGEGIGVVILKRLSDAIRDGNTIRAVIRSTGSNQDGRTPGITQPSQTAQEQLITETYQKAKLSKAHTRYFEAHGTGTPIGDPREAQAIGAAFRKDRPTEDPLYVGAVKSNIGHLEGASGLAAIIKTVLVLEKGIIPPNANFENINPKIDAERLKLRFPKESHLWPTPGLRRASINSFGYGGANWHLVMDDAYNYLRLRSLPGKHCTVPYPSHSLAITNGTSDDSETCERPKLLVWSAADQDGINRLTKTYEEYYTRIHPRGTMQSDFIQNLAYTLDSCRSHLQWRSYALLSSPRHLENLHTRISVPIQVNPQPPRIGFIFTGQGAQWYAMGRELLQYTQFRAELKRAGRYLGNLGCSWSVIEELQRPEEDSKIDAPILSQTLCAVLQIALVNLLRTFGVRPSSVLGHSSGEIAAAYAGGYMSIESAWRLAYFRGVCSASLVDNLQYVDQGAMISVGLSEDRAKKLIATFDQEVISFGLSIACINSPNNVTISGEEHLIDKIQVQLHQEGTFARKLRVPLAYHSPQMSIITAMFQSLVGTLSRPQDCKTTVPIISTVSGEPVSAKQLLDPTYWSLNMVSTVRFSPALLNMCSKSRADLVKKIDGSHRSISVVDYLLEIGPHAALQGPIRDILRVSERGSSIQYNSVLRRGQSSLKTLLPVLGELHSFGHKLNLRAINEPTGEMKQDILVDLPEYPFDHSQGYWYESRLSKNYRLREYAPAELLGVRSRDWNSAEARWRHYIKTSEMPWVSGHTIGHSILYPGAGMLVMAIEAAKQLNSTEMVNGYTLRDIQFESSMNLTAGAGQLEVQTSLHEITRPNQSGPGYEFTIRTYSNDDWVINCRGLLFVEISKPDTDWISERSAERRQDIAKSYTSLVSNCTTPVDSQQMYSYLGRCGYQYGSEFQGAQHQYCHETQKQATAKVSLSNILEENHVIHPTSLDAIFHLAFTALTAGGSKAMATSVPSRIDCLWLSNQGLSWPASSTVQACSTVAQITKRGFTCEGSALDDTTNELRLWYEGLELTNMGPVPTQELSLPNPQQFCMGVDCKASLEAMTPPQVSALLDQLHPAAQDPSRFFHDLDLLVEMSLRNLMASIDPTTLADQPQWKIHYLNWAKHHLSQNEHQRHTNGHISSMPSSEELCERLEGANPVGRLYVRVALNIVELVKGEANPLELLMRTGLLKDYYEELTTYRCAKQAISYMDLLAHQTPGLNILEVGGGTGAATRNLVRGLCAQPTTDDSKGFLRCNRYDFTDVSAAFLEDARAEFEAFKSQMTFGTLDIERSLEGQGFKEGSYDVVIALGVIHITSNFKNTLKNVRKALKPGGKLIIQESFKASGWTLGFVFGLFPGWWLGIDDNRPLSPSIDLDQWSTLLKECGYSGPDIVLRDFEQEVAHNYGWLVTTAIDPSAHTNGILKNGIPAQIIIDETCTQQHEIAGTLLSSLTPILGLSPKLLSVQELAASGEGPTEEFTIFLADYEGLFLSSLDKGTWKFLQNLARKSRHLLWVTSGGGSNPSPGAGMVDGLARTLRSEYFDRHLVTLALDPNESFSKSCYIEQIAHQMISRKLGQPYEQEYIEIDGLLHTRRLVESHHVKTLMDTKLNPFEVVRTPFATAPPFEISMITGSAGEVPRYVHSPPLEGNLEGDAVDVLVKSAQFLPHSHGSALGNDKDSRYTGPDATLYPGDRVVATLGALISSHIRAPSSTLMKIPDRLSFSNACHIVPPMAAAYHLMVEKAHFKTTDSILIHGGASPIGLAALQLISSQGVTDIWATASSQKECTWISTKIGVTQDRILPNAWFGDHPMGSLEFSRRFDIILSVDEDSMPPLLSGCLNSRGRYIILQSALAPASHNARATRSELSDASISIIDVAQMHATQEALQYAVNFPKVSSIRLPVDYVFDYTSSELASAFNKLQDASHRDSIVMNFADSDTIDIITETRITYTFESDATYLVAGGLGGLGRTITRWLVGHGARNLILLSRSGPRTQEAKDLIVELEESGVHIKAPRCDVSDQNAVKSVLANCSGMPPIRGCVQVSMVLTESIFEKLSFPDWKSAVDPKIKGSWNLHTELPKGLDFFILVSSIMGVMGTPSLAGYNAGNTYQDALARYRVSTGERAVSIDLGAVVDSGYLTEHQHHRDSLQYNPKLTPIVVKEFCALLDIYCDPNLNLQGDPSTSQCIIGIRPPSYWKGLEDVPHTFAQPFWKHMHHLPSPEDSDGGETAKGGEGAGSQKRIGDTLEKLARTQSLAEAADVISEAVAQRVSVLLGTAWDRLDPHKPMQSYGIDSLSAIDFQNWVGKAFGVEMPVFEILGGATLSSTSMSIARQLQSKR